MALPDSGNRDKDNEVQRDDALYLIAADQVRLIFPTSMLITRVEHNGMKNNLSRAIMSTPPPTDTKPKILWMNDPFAADPEYVARLKEEWDVIVSSALISYYNAWKRELKWWALAWYLLDMCV